MKAAILSVVITILFGSFSSLDAQRLSVGMMGGGQGIPSVQSVDLPYYSNSGSTSKQLIFGPTLEFRLPFELGLEADVLKRQIFGHAEECFPCSFTGFHVHYQQEDANGHSWEFALLAKKYVKSIGVVRPFGTAGIGERVTSGNAHIQGYDLFSPTQNGTNFSDTESVQSKKSTAALLGFGAEVKIKHRLLISPQLRYGRWSNRPFSQAGFVSNRNSLDILLSLRLGL